MGPIVGFEMLFFFVWCCWPIFVSLHFQGLFLQALNLNDENSVLYGLQKSNGSKYSVARVNACFWKQTGPREAILSFDTFSFFTFYFVTAFAFLLIFVLRLNIRCVQTNYNHCLSSVTASVIDSKHAGYPSS